MALREKLVLQVLKVKLGLLVRVVLLVPWVLVVFQERGDVLVHPVLLVLVVMMVSLAQLAHLDPLALLEHQVSPAHQVQKVKLAPLVLVALRALKDPEVNLEALVHLDLRELRATLELTESLVLKDLRVLLALLVLLVFLAHVDLLGLKVLLGLWVPKASRENLALQASKVNRVPRANLALQAHKVVLDQQEKKAREGLVVNQELLDRLGHLVRGAPLEIVVSQVKMD